MQRFPILSKITTINPHQWLDSRLSVKRAGLGFLSVVPIKSCKLHHPCPETASPRII